MKTLLFFCVVIAAATIASCSDSSSPTKPEPTLIGKWKWVQTMGGIGGWTYTPATEGYTATLLIQSNTHCAIYKNDTIVQAGNCTFTTTDSITYFFDLTTGFTDSLLHQKLDHVVLTSDTASFKIAMKMTGDSLSVWDYNVADGFGSLFIRQ
ncbi:MAG TPA: hypothetical protein VFO76_00465 [Candidatus Kapabacteria bacterium]|nr:hypothetical protein [Candidatus Kapabacteria bacterium]